VYRKTKGKKGGKKKKGKNDSTNYRFSGVTTRVGIERWKESVTMVHQERGRGELGRAFTKMNTAETVAPRQIAPFG